MPRVKMNAKHEYEFIGNFKILQNAFRAHKIDKVCRYTLCVGRAEILTAPVNQPIPVEKLVKCKMQYVKFSGSEAHVILIYSSPRFQGQSRIHAMDETLLGC